MGMIIVICLRYSSEIKGKKVVDKIRDTVEFRYYYVIKSLDVKFFFNERSSYELGE